MLVANSIVCLLGFSLQPAEHFLCQSAADMQGYDHVLFAGFVLKCTRIDFLKIIILFHKWNEII